MGGVGSRVVFWTWPALVAASCACTCVRASAVVHRGCFFAVEHAAKFLMGISGLFDALKGYVRPCHIEALRGQRVGIDTYSWLHKASFGCATGATAVCLVRCLDRLNSMRDWRLKMPSPARFMELAGCTWGSPPDARPHNDALHILRARVC